MIMTHFDELKNEILELQSRLRKSEEEKEEIRIRLNDSQMRVTELETELNARTVVMKNVETQTIDNEALDQPLVIPVSNNSTTSQMFEEIRTLLHSLSDDAPSVVLDDKNESCKQIETAVRPCNEEVPIDEDEIKAAKKKVRNAKKNRAKLLRRKEKKLVLQLQPADDDALPDEPSRLPETNPSETDDGLLVIEDHSSNALSNDDALVLPEIEPESEDCNFLLNADAAIPSTPVSGNGIPTSQCTDSELLEVRPEERDEPRATEYPVFWDHYVKPEETEFLLLSNFSYSMSAHTIVSYFENMVGPVKWFSIFLDEDGVFRGKARVLFWNPADASRALLLCQHMVIGEQRMKIKLIVNGQRLYPDDVLRAMYPLYPAYLP
jgi:hypothetical protein